MSIHVSGFNHPSARVLVHSRHPSWQREVCRAQQIEETYVPPSFVYGIVLTCDHVGYHFWIKVGRSCNPKQRFDQIVDQLQKAASSDSGDRPNMPHHDCLLGVCVLAQLRYLMVGAAQTERSMRQLLALDIPSIERRGEWLLIEAADPALYDHIYTDIEQSLAEDEHAMSEYGYEQAVYDWLDELEEDAAIEAMFRNFGGTTICDQARYI